MAPSTIEDRNGKRYTTEVNVVGSRSHRSTFRTDRGVKIYIPMTFEEALEFAPNVSLPCWRIDLYEV